MKVLLLFVVIIAGVGSTTALDLLRSEWELFKAKYAKKYESVEEENDRLRIFADNWNKISNHNARYASDEESFTLAVNQFADLTADEFNERMNRLKMRTRHERSVSSSSLDTVSEDELPESVDWRTVGAVTPVKDQGQCGSCYSFSATGSLEGQHFLKTGNLTSLSEQNILDCSSSYGNEGCDGGWMDSSFAYIADNDGIDTEASYPYLATDGNGCKYNKDSRGATDTGFVDIPSGNETALQVAVATIGPISVAIDASHDSFRFYSTGVYNEPNCSSTDLDHGVLAVGYGTDENNLPYWLVKNSWGESYGDDGYIRMSRNLDNQCGIASTASYPVV